MLNQCSKQTADCEFGGTLCNFGKTARAIGCTHTFIMNDRIRRHFSFKWYVHFAVFYFSHESAFGNRVFGPFFRPHGAFTTMIIFQGSILIAKLSHHFIKMQIFANSPMMTDFQAHNKIHSTTLNFHVEVVRAYGSRQRKLTADTTLVSK